MKEKLSSTMEDYLESIAALQNRGDGIVRVRDISASLDVKSPTVNAALKILSEKDLVKHQRYGYVTLTAKGQKVASEIQKKHDILVKFLTKILNIDASTASEDACKMEHTMSPKTFSRLTKFIEFVDSGLNNGNPQWLKSYKHYAQTGTKLMCKARKSVQEFKGK